MALHLRLVDVFLKDMGRELATVALAKTRWNSAVGWWGVSGHGLLRTAFYAPLYRYLFGDLFLRRSFAEGDFSSLSTAGTEVVGGEDELKARTMGALSPEGWIAASTRGSGSLPPLGQWKWMKANSTQTDANAMPLGPYDSLMCRSCLLLPDPFQQPSSSTKLYTVPGVEQLVGPLQAGATPISQPSPHEHSRLVHEIK